MRIKNNKIKFLIVVLILFICCLFVRTNDTFGIYKSTVSTTVNLTVLDPSTNFVVTLALNDGSGTTSTVNKHYNDQMGSDLTTPSLADHNFMGWYTDPTNGTKVSSSTTITSNITFYAHWSKIVCKKVTNDANLHTETCNTTSGHGCRISNVYALNDPITYGTTVENDDPKAGDAFDCDVDYDGVYNPGDPYTNGKYTERFYFIREKENSGSENSVVLVYYTSFDADGRVGIPPKVKNDIGSYHYAEAQTYLPTSTLWDNPKLADFDGNGKVSRFLTLDDLHESCGPDTTVSHYLNNCEYLLENSRFQSEDLGRAGIWLEMSGNKYYRIQTSGLTINTPDTGANSENMVRPVIEIPISALDGFVNEERYTITFNSHGGSSVDSIRRYSGQAVGTLPDDPIREHYDFDGWYTGYESVNGEDVYTNKVTSSTIITGNVTFHAKWVSKYIRTVRFDANGGTIDGESYKDVEVDLGDTIDPLPVPIWGVKYFAGWYDDPTNPTVRFTTSDAVNDNMTVYAKWEIVDYAAEVNGVGYISLEAAIDAVPIGKVKTTVTLLKDITLTDTLEIPDTKWVELDGDSYTISGSLANLIENSGNLDIIDGTTITTPVMTTTSTLITNASGAILNISGGSLINPSNNGTLEFLTVNNLGGGTVNITGGTLTSYGQSACVNNKGTINMSDGEIIAHNTSKGQAIYMDAGRVTISGDAYLENVSGTGDSRACVDNNGGTLIITGGTVVSKGYSAVIARKNGSTTRIGTSDTYIDISTPVLRGKRYGLEKASAATTATIEVYDGIFESLDQTQAISTTSVTKPDNIDFKTDGSVLVEGVTYHAAYLLAPSITVNFYEEVNGTAIPVEVDNGAAIGSDLPTPNQKQGYYFAGWFIDGNPLMPVTSSTEVTGPFNAYARWVIGVADANLSTTPSPFVLTVGNNGQISLSATNQGDEVEDYELDTDDEDVVTIGSNNSIVAEGVGTTDVIITGLVSNVSRRVSVTVNAVTYTVTFKDGGSVIKTVNVSSGGTVGAEMPANQTKSGYIFNGWVFENNNTLTSFTSATEVLGNIEVNASWKETVSVATLPDDPISITVGTNKQILVTATDSNNLVEDYALSSSNTNIVEVSGKTIYGSSVGSVTLTITGAESHVPTQITVYVVNSYNVTFDPDNGDTQTVIQVEVGSSIDDSGATLPQDPTKTDYVFDNWYIYDEVNETLTTTRLDTTATVSSDITYKAKYVSDTYKVVVYGDTITYHTTLQSAFNAAPTNGTATEVKLLQSIVNPTGRSQVLDGRNVVLIGGNYSVTCGASTTNQMIYSGQGSTLRIKSGTYSCGQDKLATLEGAAGSYMYIDGGLIENTNNRAAIFNNGIVEITGGTLTSVAPERGVVQNAGATSSITMSGGTVNQLASSTMGALHNGKSGSSITITGGTVTSVGNAIQNINGTTLTVGTQNGSYDATSPVIQGDLYGITSTVNYSIYDGIIKGKSNNQAVDDFTKITGTETGVNRITGTEGSYYTLYYELPNLKYVISFNANDGTVTPSSIEFDVNEEITSNDLPTPTRENHTFDGWYKDVNLQTPFTTFTPDSAGSTTYFAKWTFNSSLTPVTHNVLSNAMQEYFTDVSSWVAADATDPSNNPPREASQENNYDNGHSMFKSSIEQVFTDNSCSYCAASSNSQNRANNDCNYPSTGTYCDQPSGYDTGLTEDLNVYLYENGVKDNNIVPYITSTGGIIYNMIPGVTYLWESSTDNTKYGVVTATGERRTLKTAVRNLRDLGGLSASNSDVSGTIDYGRLYRGAQITTAQGVTDLTKLGVTREVDLRGNGDGVQTFKMTNYDTGTSNPNSYDDIEITNYIINPVATTYISTAYPLNYAAVKSAMREIMEKVVFNHDSIFFHCTIGTDRTGTIAYFLEGLLGVSEEDRLRDYEMTYFFGLTNRLRFHDSVSWSNIKPRFYSMYRSYPSNTAIYNYYTFESHVPNPNDPNDLTDDELLRRFRLELIH